MNSMKLATSAMTRRLNVARPAASLARCNRVGMGGGSLSPMAASTSLMSRRFGSHGPPTNYGPPHDDEYGIQSWAPLRAYGVLLFSSFIVIYGSIWFLNWDSIPYPAHRYNTQANMGRNWD